MRKFIILALAGLTLAACDYAADKENIGGHGCTPLDYEQGIYYFPCTESKFANALSEFRANNPLLRILAIAGNGTGAYGYDRGYFVAVEVQ